MEIKDHEIAITIKWDSDNRFFKAYMPNGEILPKCLGITLSDSYDPKSGNTSGLVIATITAFVNVE